MPSAKGFACSIYDEILRRLRPKELIQAISIGTRKIRAEGEHGRITLPYRSFNRIYVCGAGKASAGLAQAAVKQLGQRVAGGLVVTKYGHGFPMGPVSCRLAGHPIPDDGSLSAGIAMLSFAAECQEGDLVLFFLSGGASALMEAPIEGVSLKDLATVSDHLLKAGASILELNAVRSRLSRIKGGGLGRAFGKATVVCFVLSDVLGNDLSVIGSGPLWKPSQLDAFAIAERYDLTKQLSEAARAALEEPAASGGTEIRHVILGDAGLVLSAAMAASKIHRLKPLVYGHPMTDEARIEASRLVDQAKILTPPFCLIATGETVVKVKGQGKGGRCQEFACAAAELIKGWPNTAVLAGSTDGTDGPTNVAAGVVDGDSADQAAISVRDALAENDSLRFLESCGGLIRTGPTQCNLNDVYMIVRLA